MIGLPWISCFPFIFGVSFSLIFLFFWFEVFSVVESTSRSVFSDSCLEKNISGKPHPSLWTVVSLLISLFSRFVSPSRVLCILLYSGRSRFLLLAGLLLPVTWGFLWNIPANVPFLEPPWGPLSEVLTRDIVLWILRWAFLMGRIYSPSVWSMVICSRRCPWAHLWQIERRPDLLDHNPQWEPWRKILWGWLIVHKTWLS